MATITRDGGAGGTSLRALVEQHRLLRLSKELEALLRRPVDVVSRGGLKPRDRAILEEAIDL
jgi:predicted nucleotidyltransferase